MGNDTNAHVSELVREIMLSFYMSDNTSNDNCHYWVSTACARHGSKHITWMNSFNSHNFILNPWFYPQNSSSSFTNEETWSFRG